VERARRGGAPVPGGKEGSQAHQDAREREAKAAAEDKEHTK
jgi:hypothetical protein